MPYWTTPVIIRVNTPSEMKMTLELKQAILVELRYNKTREVTRPRWMIKALMALAIPWLFSSTRSGMKGFAWIIICGAKKAAATQKVEMSEMKGIHIKVAALRIKKKTRGFFRPKVS